MRNHRKILGLFLLACAATLVAGCASVQSVAVTGAGALHGGLVYYLPMQRIKLTLTVNEDSTRSIEVAPTAAFADTAHRFVAQYRGSQVGTNLLNVNVGVDGLLEGDSTGSSTPNLSDLIGSFAALGRSGTSLKSLKQTTAQCTTSGTYEWIFDVPIDTATSSGMAHCGVRVEVGPIDSEAPTVSWAGTGGNTRGAGFFYRQKRPVQITVSVDDPDAGTSSRLTNVFMIVDAHSPIEFLPVPRSVFATSSWTLKFTNGSPTLYDLNTGGEVLGLFKLPAEVVSAYSKAVTAGFRDRNSIPKAQAEYLQQLNALAVQQAKAEACRAAVATRDLDKINTACQ
jgi:hypothetical protein